MNGYTAPVSEETRLTNILARLVNCAGLVRSLEIAYIACEQTEPGDMPALVRGLDYQTRVIENEKHAKELEWDRLTGDFMDGAAFDRAEIRVQTGRAR